MFNDRNHVLSQIAQNINIMSIYLDISDPTGLFGPLWHLSLTFSSVVCCRAFNLLHGCCDWQTNERTDWFIPQRQQWANHHKEGDLPTQYRFILTLTFSTVAYIHIFIQGELKSFLSIPPYPFPFLPVMLMPALIKVKGPDIYTPPLTGKP